MTEPFTPEPLTPVQVESKLRRLIGDLTKAQVELSKARDGELFAEIRLKRARAKASASAECPKPSRGGVTVAERDAWIDARVAQEWEHYRAAVVCRDIAQDALRTHRDIASVVQSLASSVRVAYDMAGRAS